MQIRIFEMLIKQHSISCMTGLITRRPVINLTIVRIFDCHGWNGCWLNRNPQQFAPVIHIAGSKGKGSVAWLIAESLRRSGYRTGLYTSPHLIQLEERFVVNGTAINADELIEAVEAVRPAANQLAKEGHGHATFFELTTAIAWWIFRQRQVDVNVIEVGLGGRLDSTNVCWPALSVITSISYDHQQQLGETLAEIAFEKAESSNQGFQSSAVPRIPRRPPSYGESQRNADVC